MPEILFAMLSGVGLLALAGSFLGALHPAGDSLAVFRGPLSVAGVVWFAAGWGVGLASGWLILPCAAAFLSVARHYLRREDENAPALVHYQKNMSCRMRGLDAIEADIRAVAPDFVTLQEVTPANAALLARLADILPYSHACAYENVGAVALASRWPIQETAGAIDAHGMAARRVRAPGGPLWVVSVHLHWPWPADPTQAAQLDPILAALARLDGPVLLGGDFNMVRWSSVVRRTAQAIGAEPGGRARGSFRLGRFLTLAIDQSLVPKGRRGRSAVRPLAGSDHKGLVVRF